MKKSPRTRDTKIFKSLFKSLSVFALRDIDLYKIESRPIPGSPWEYLFYLDFSGDIRQNVSKHAIAHLEEIAKFMKILGSYRRGNEVKGVFNGKIRRMNVV